MNWRQRLWPSASIAALLLLFAAPPLAAAAELGAQEFDCLIEPHVTSKVSAPVAGVISRVLVDRGDVVRREQVIAKLESSVEEAAVALARTRAENDKQVESARARAEFLNRKVARLQQLRPNNVVAEAQFDEAMAEAQIAAFNLLEAEGNLKVARMELQRAEAQLEQRIVRSPLDGVVVDRALSAGEYRNEQSHILTVAQIDPLNVQVYVPVAFYRQVALGAQAEVRPEAPIGGRHSARVSVVDRVLDAASGTFGVRLSMPNPDYRLPGGLRCKLRFMQSEAQAPDGSLRR